MKRRVSSSSVAATSRMRSGASQSATEETEPVTQLSEYLTYYKSREKPGYAVLVTGEWGTGKTFQVLRALKEDERYYVSLFGVKSTDDIYAAVFAEMSPIKARIRELVKGGASASAKVGFVSIPVGAAASTLTNAFIKDAVELDRTIIFDDLERCSVNIGDTLGAINRYVEHHGCRVVVIAHDEKIVGAFGESKEKLIGQTIRVKPEIEAAYNVFTEQFETAREAVYLRKFKGEIIGVFKQSNAGSLRVLRHAIEDVSRLLRALNDEHLANEEAMLELIRLFAAYDIELRASHITSDAIRDRQMANYSFVAKRMNAQRTGEDIETPPTVAMQERHSLVDFNSKLLTDDVLFSTLVEGIYDQAAIRLAVNDSPYFRTPETTPSWKRFMDFDNLPDEEGEAAMNMMLKQFERREITIPGEIIHVFALRLMMSDKGLSKLSFDEVEKECKSYVDDLSEAEKLPTASMRSDGYEDLSFGHGGYAYWINDEATQKEHFLRLVRYLANARKEALKRTLPKYGPEILALVEGDGEGLITALNHSYESAGKFARLPVLAQISPTDFVEAWLQSPSKNWRSVQMALVERVKRMRGDELAEELPWMREVCTLMEAEAAKTTALRALKIRRSVGQIEVQLADYEPASAGAVQDNLIPNP